MKATLVVSIAEAPRPLDAKLAAAARAYARAYREAQDQHLYYSTNQNETRARCENVRACRAQGDFPGIRCYEREYKQPNCPACQEATAYRSEMIAANLRRGAALRHLLKVAKQEMTDD